jgi:hypothetical protein
MDDTSPEVAAMVADRYLVGIDIDHASKKVDLEKLILSRLRGEVESWPP